jgi:hypothetical protein
LFCKIITGIEGLGTSTSSNEKIPLGDDSSMIKDGEIYISPPS